MAWTAFAAAERLSVSGFQLKHVEQLQAFKAAEDKVQKQADAADGGLAAGVLCCSTCGSMLQRALGKEYPTNGGWTPDQLKASNNIANWNFKYSKEEAWAYWSARLWLKTCAELGLGASLG